ncbi:MAG: hypothetical protein HY755_07895 [Nitrospirae bacterium]|nr:hypothetical protein [Nitrospirota bacterium]
MNCWEYMKCQEETYKHCPAYPEKGLDCWKVTDTKCAKGTVEKLTIEEKIKHCRTCEFYIKHAHRF